MMDKHFDNMKIVTKNFQSILVLLLGYVFLVGCSKLQTTSDIKSPYSYDDGLERSTPEDQGVPSEAILQLFQKVEEKGYAVHGLMMLRHGKVIAEHWWAPYAPQYQHAMYSATKTFTSTAIGFAVQEGLLNVEDKVTSFFPGLLPDSISPELAELTVKHLLTMTVGHASTRYQGSGLSQVRSFLAAPFAYEPGTTFAYNITASHMLSHILTKVSGVTILEYLQPRLFEPLGIKDVVWEMDNDGINMGNGGSHMKTSDLAKMGLFYLNKGKWNGKQLLNPEWIEAATSPHIYQHPELTPKEMENADDDGSQGYGYQIWLGRHNSYRAAGAQTQIFMVIPEYDFVLACHAQIGDEAGFCNLFYEILPTISDTKIKTEPTIDLNAVIENYELERPFENTSVTKVTMSTRRYQMDENPAGINSVLFRFDSSGNCYLTFVKKDAVHNIPFGLDNWLHGMTDRSLSFARTVYPNPMGVTPVNTAGICTWTDENHLAAHYLSMFNPGSTETFNFAFEGDQFKMEVIAPTMRRMGPPGTPQPETRNLVFTGTRITD